MMKDAVLHPSTRRDIDALVAAGSHALALTGPAGVGKGFVAEQTACVLLRYDKDIRQHPFFLRVSPSKQTIGIDEARQVTNFLKLKTTGASSIRRVVLIEHADTMTIEAQNALLKNIEEPPADTVIVLTLDARTGVLPTIASRVQMVSIRPPLIPDLQAYLVGQGFAENDAQKTLLLCDGLPGLATALLRNDQTDEFVAAINTAKTLLASDVFTRLKMVDEIVATKQTMQVVSALIHIAQAALVASSGRQGPANSATKKWTNVAARASLAHTQLKASAQAKLVLTSTCMHI